MDRLPAVPRCPWRSHSEPVHSRRGSDANAVVTPNGYRHTIAEEHAALRAMLADIESKLKSGELTEANLDPSIRNLRTLEKADFLGAWIAINAAMQASDPTIPTTAPPPRHLVDYVNHFLIH